MTDPDPRVDSSAHPKPIPRASGGEAPAGGRADVLIVDNDERIVELLSWFLSKRGYSVKGAHSFSQAREFLAVSPPDLMLSDLDLGAESALVELPRLAEAGLLPPTLVVSGYLNAETTQRLTSLPQVLGVLAKPFDFARLEEQMVSCLEKLHPQTPDPSPADSPERIPPDSATTGGASAGEWVEIRPHPPGQAAPPPPPEGTGGAGSQGNPDSPQGAVPPTPPTPLGTYRASSHGSAVR